MTSAPPVEESGVNLYPPVQAGARQFTVRAVVTGMVLGAILSLCNIYMGLKIGWGFNMSISAALLGFALWEGTHRFLGGRPFGILENNINQTAASAAASISSAGLVAPIPALTMLTDYSWSYHVLVLWTLSVGLVGVVVAIGLRRQMLIVDDLPFPNGVATGETLKEMYAKGSEAMARVRMLITGGVVAGVIKVVKITLSLPKVGIPVSFAAKSQGALAAKGHSAISLKNLGFALDPSLLMIGVGAIIGIQASAAIFLGGVIAWLVIAPMVLELGWADPGKQASDAIWFGSLVKWMLWPGVAMMVTGALTSVSFSWRSMVRAFRFTGSGPVDPDRVHEVSKKAFLAALMVVLLASVALQSAFFGVGIALAIFGVLLTFALAIVAGRVSGETSITPVGAMGKVTQLTFGVIDPANAMSNLMAANVTGGAASQCADMLHDLKTGRMVGSVPRLQVLSQALGVLAGALAGSAAYLILIPDPKTQLLTDEWAAPAVAQWKAVAEVFSVGIEAMPEGAPLAMLVAGIVGIVLSVAMKIAPRKVAIWIPSPSSMGIAFCIPAYYCLSFFVGGLAYVAGTRLASSWTARFAIVLAAGIIAGESLVGVGDALIRVLRGLAGG